MKVSALMIQMKNGITFYKKYNLSAYAVLDYKLYYTQI